MVRVFLEHEGKEGQRVVEVGLVREAHRLAAEKLEMVGF